ncbi:helix-turn-helix domain-containing protein [Streptomyces sp. NPDC006739]|uniref:helix-turn-helix domain-containing protein n=1 Tax=Streptomyces sp. NPDC006739 TaxID=3364763 RepID=UPI0036B92996
MDEVAEFAELLRELKARTGRSYDSLARRVRMNTSTLHRYCAGEAVPQDFAPVERLAAFCGASERERLELHRRWLRALAARQSPRASSAPVAADAEEEPRVPAAPPRPDTAAPKTDNAAPGTPTVARQPGVGHEPAPRPPRQPRRRMVAAGAAVVVTVVLATVSFTLYTDRTRSAPAASSTATAGALAAPAHPSHSPTAGTQAPAVRASDSPPADARTSPSATGADPAQGVPLTWTADSQVWDGGCDHDYVVTRAPRDVPPPPAPEDAATWAAAQSAVHGHETDVRISVQGRSDTPVVLQDLRIRVVGRTHPAPGNAYSMAQGCGSDMTPHYFAVDLDKDRPLARSVPAVDQGVRQPAVNMPYRVSVRDPEELLVKATTDGCDCRWYLELDWSSQGRTGTVRIDDHGQPFRTSAIKGLPHYWYGSVGARRQWVPLTG